jgi:hypothetical protein
MNVPVILLVLAVLCCFWNIATSVRIYDFLRRRGVKASFFWLRVMAPKYAHQYKKMTAAESGTPGPLWLQWIVSINLAWVFALIALFVHFA